MLLIEQIRKLSKKETKVNHRAKKFQLFSKWNVFHQQQRNSPRSLRWDRNSNSTCTNGSSIGSESPTRDSTPFDAHRGSQNVSSPTSRMSSFSDLPSTASTTQYSRKGLPSPNPYCPSCGLQFGLGIRRKLLDADCGHERCYECMMEYENCPECHAEPQRYSSRVKRRKQKSQTQDQTSPSSTRSSRKGRESGFQSYVSIASSVHDPKEEHDHEYLSDTSSVISLMSSFSVRENSNYNFRRNGSSRRSGISTCSEKSYVSRNGYARRSLYQPNASRFTEMSAILENTLNSGPDDTYMDIEPTGSIFSERKLNLIKREPFLGRSWIFRTISETFSSDLPTNQGIVISGEGGAGKSAIINYLVNPGSSMHPYVKDLSSKVIANFEIRKDDETKGLATYFVHKLQAQMFQNLEHLGFRDTITFQDCCADPSAAFKKGILEELKRAKGQLLSQRSYYVIAVDGMDNADFFPTNIQAQSIAKFLETHLDSIPNWIKLILTTRPTKLNMMKDFPFQRISLDDVGFDERISKDIRDYVLVRIKSNETLAKNCIPTAWKYETKPHIVLADYLAQLSHGSFLFLKSVLDLLENDVLVIKSSNFNVIPQKVSEVFRLRLNLLFPTRKSYELTRKIFSVCLATLRNLRLDNIFECISAADTNSQLTEEDFRKAYNMVAEFLPQDTDDGTVRFFHDSFRDWLLEKVSDDCNRFSCDVNFGHSALTMWLSQKSSHLNANETLDLGHHLMKAQLFKSKLNEDNNDLSTKELRTMLMESVSKSPSKAIVCQRNLINPNEVVTRLLLQAKANPDVRVEDESNAPILCHFTQLGNETMVRTLIEFGADASAVNSKGITALMMASRTNNINMLQVLLESNQSLLNQTSNEGFSSLSFASKMGSIEALNFLLQQSWPSRGVCRQMAVQEALITAVKSTQLESLKVLMSDKDAALSSPCLLSHEMPLEAAIKTGCTQALEMLLNGGAELARLSYPLHLAIENGHVGMTRMLISVSDPAELSKKDSSGKSCLVLASYKGYLDIVKLLVYKGCDVNQRDSKGMSALSWACLKGHSDLVNYLLTEGEQSCDIHSCDDTGRTCLHYAAISGKSEIVANLLKVKADVEKSDTNGIRAIDQAISSGSLDCVTLFLRKGAKLGPTTWIMAKGKPAILLLLLNKLLEDGNKLHMNERYQEATYRYQYALKKLPAKLEQKSVFLQLKAHLLLNLSRTHRKEQKFAASIERADQVLEFKPDSSEALWCKARTNFDAAIDEESTMERREKLENSLSNLRSAIRLAPDNNFLHNFASKVKSELEKFETVKYPSVHVQRDENVAA